MDFRNFYPLLCESEIDSMEDERPHKQTSGESSMEMCRVASASRPCETYSHDDIINNEPHYQQQQHLTKDDEMIHDDKYEASLQSRNKHLLKSEEERTRHDDDESLQRAIRESSAIAKNASQLKSESEFEDELQRAIHDDDNDAKPPAIRGTDSNITEEDELQKAIRQSIQDYANNNQKNTTTTYETTTTATAALHPKCKTLNNVEFTHVIYEYLQLYGGIHAIEKSNAVKDGNSNSLKHYGKHKSHTAYGGGKHQTGAQFGTFSVENMYRIYNVLEGKANVRLDEPQADLHLIPNGVMEELGFVRDESTGKYVMVDDEDGNNDNNSSRDSSPSKRLEGLAAAKIQAFVDIGHGFGIQVLQAGWSLGVPSRGIELMADRHNIALQIRDGVIDRYRDDPPDSTMVELKLADFTRAMIPDVETYASDANLRSFLLFKDKTMKIQRGLVIFVNNAENVFGPRSNQKKDGLFLDHYLAQLFANMEIGGRMVTLTDVSCYLNNGNDDWYTRDVFLSGLGAVLWSSYFKSSICVYVLTKMSNSWKCRFCKKTSAVITDDGQVCNRCVWCDRETKNTTRNKKRKRC
eukprot:scaffold15443_cov50-Cyclotella_meneghiniana.AAC.5